MKPSRWFLFVPLIVALCLAACGPEAQPATEATLTPAEPTAVPSAATPTPANAESASPETEPGRGPASAAEIPVGTSTGVLKEDEEDWLAFSVPNGHILNVAFAAGEDCTKSMTVSLLDPDQHEIWYEADIEPEMTKSLKLTEDMLADTEGVYYLVMASGRGNYTIQIQ